MRKWKDLSVKDKAAFMKLAVKNGITDIDSIKETYESIGSNNIAANGGSIQVKQKEKPLPYYERARLNRARNRQLYGDGGNKNGFFNNLGMNTMRAIESFHDVNPMDLNEVKWAYKKFKDKKSGNFYYPSDLYLMSPEKQAEMMLTLGYIPGEKGDYGTAAEKVSRSSNPHMPVYQRYPHQISRNQITPIGRGYRGENFESWLDENPVTFNMDNGWLIDPQGHPVRNDDRTVNTAITDALGAEYWDDAEGLIDAGNYQYVLYRNPDTGDLYTNAWDVNNYADKQSPRYQEYPFTRKIAANILDAFGNPFVQTLGYQKVPLEGYGYAEKGKGYMIPNVTVTSKQGKTNKFGWGGLQNAVNDNIPVTLDDLFNLQKNLFIEHFPDSKLDEFQNKKKENLLTNEDKVWADMYNGSRGLTWPNLPKDAPLVGKYYKYTKKDYSLAPTVTSIANDYSKDVSNSILGLGTPKNSGAIAPKLNFGQATQNLSNKLTNKASDLLGGDASGLVNAGFGMIGGLANQGFSKLFSNGLSSGVGNAIGSVGGTVGSLVGSVNPVLGAGISAATGILGGITNTMFGSKLNQEHIAAVENSNAALNNTKISSNDTASALNDMSSINWGADFTKRDIGRDGWFANKAKKKYNELSDAQSLARSRAMSASDTAVSNIATNQRRNAMANFSAYGGPVNKYSLGSDLKQANIDYINAFGRPEWIPPILPFAKQQQEEIVQSPIQNTQEPIQLSDDYNWYTDNIINGNLSKNYGIDTNGWQNQIIHSFNGTAGDYRTSFNNLMNKNANIVGDIYNTLISKGFTPAQASGALGNIMVESGFRDINASDPTKNNPNNIARGYFQMGDLETKNFNKWKQRTALAADTPSHIAQAMYVADMLNGGGYDYLGYVRGHEKTTKQQARDWFNSTNPADAATGFMLRYEKPGTPNENLRRAYADLFYNYYGNQSKYGGKIKRNKL